MKRFLTHAIFHVVFLTTIQGFAISDISKSVADQETRFIILEFPKYDKTKMQLLIAELNTYVGKIADVRFDHDTHQMTIYYYTSIKLDDVLEVASKSGMDFNKISGTELQ